MSMANQPPNTTKEGWRPTKKQIIAAIIVVVALLFVLQNTNTGHFHFLWFDFEAPIWIWLLLVFAGGIATGLLIANRRARRQAAQT